MYDECVPELYRPELYFAADSMSLSPFSSMQRAPEKIYRVKWYVTVVPGHSRSSKLVSTVSPYASYLTLNNIVMLKSR